MNEMKTVSVLAFSDRLKPRRVVSFTMVLRRTSGRGRRNWLEHDDIDYSYGNSPYGSANSYGFGKRDYYAEMIGRNYTDSRVVRVRYRKRI
jgi:hypothetical protein